ncbi:mitochondrial inner membrane protease subunit 1 isoform X1 [Tripterygium wilfordii]|uniref:mitochondrial inner membrane protease subunit 1 isoform X1 n=1 Tax=Tripterygium wilfordii TaxID=458696 RepID=UPI0018F85D4C|nr:mitochondrial inner membrane protease subunit 1 isoform X1 [Tripterygium wilfordii]
MRLLNYMRQWRGFARDALEQTSIVAKFLCLLHVTNTYVCSSTLVYGVSMLPTLNIAGDVVLAEHMSHRMGKVSPGDLVLVKSPIDPRKTMTKRVMAMEGDRVTFLVDPNYSDRSCTVLVPKGHVWIQGDNIYASRDSRHFGPVPYGLIQGKVFWRVWPPEFFGSLRQ